MEKKDPLDEFLQRQFAKDDPERRIVFREEHWLQAQALLDAAARRRRFFWWWAGTALVFLLAGGWWLMRDSVASSSLPEAPPAETTALPTAITPQEASDTTTETIVPLLSPPQTTHPAPAGTIPADPMATTSSGRHAATLPDPTQSGPAAGALDRPLPTAGAVVQEKGVVNAQATRSDPSPTDVGEASGESSAPLLFNPFDLLPAPLLPIAPPERPSQAPTPSRSPEITTPEPVRFWRRELGVVAAGASPTGHLLNEKTGVGLGLSTRWQRRDSRFSLNAGLLWRWRQGGFEASASDLGPVEQLRYSFGFELDRYDKRVKGTHWLEIPLSVQYQLNPVNLELGVMPARLLLVQGEEKHVRQTSLYPDAERVDVKRIRLDNLYFKNWTGSAFAGVAWQPNRRLELGLRIHYQPGAIRTESYSNYGPASGQNPLWADVRVRFFYRSPEK